MPEMHQTIPLSEALLMIDHAVGATRLPAQTVPVRDSLGRTLVVDQASRLDLPPFNKSAMDGYAVLAGDERGSYRLLETVPAGCVPSCKLEPGTTIKVMTGAPVPDGAGKVIMVEDTSANGDAVQVLRHGSASNICVHGEDVRTGDVIMRAPAVLGPVEIGNLIACGICEVEVAARPRVCILATGAEIVDSPDQLRPGRIMNSNGPMLAALCQAYSLDVAGEWIVPDERAATAAAIRDALDASDIVLLTGGVSVGDFDYVCQALADAGLRPHFSGVAVKPGKPATFAAGDGKAVFGLPGNPVSVYLMFHLLVLRAVRLLTGGEPESRSFEMPLAADYQRRRAERTEYIPCRLSQKGKVIPAKSHGSADLRALLGCDGFFVVPQGIASVCAGDVVKLILTRPLWANSFDGRQASGQNPPAPGGVQ